MNYQQLHPAVAAKLLSGEKDRELYKLIILCKIYPEDGDISQQMLAQFTVCTFATDADDARMQLAGSWEETMPTGAILLFVLSNAPVPGSVEEGSMMVHKTKLKAV